MVTDASGNVSFGGTAAMSTSFLRNRIINGDMRVDQRNAGASVTPVNTQYTIDRYQSQISQTAKYSVSQSSTAPVGFSKSLLVTSLSAYSVLAADFFAVGQAIEGYNISDFNYGTADSTTATLSFWVRSSLTGTFGGAINSGSGSFPFTYSIASANTWTNISVAISANTAYAPTSTTNGVGLYVWFGLGVGSTFSGTAGSWQSGFKESATGATSVVGTSGATFYVTGVQLEVGTVATPFERQIYSNQLAQCQRYYEEWGGGDAYQAFGIADAISATVAYSALQYLVTKRAAPSGSVSAASNFHTVRGGVAFTDFTFGSLTTTSTLATITVASGLTAGQAYTYRANGTLNARIKFNAEL